MVINALTKIVGIMMRIFDTTINILDATIKFIISIDDNPDDY